MSWFGKKKDKEEAARAPEKTEQTEETHPEAATSGAEETSAGMFNRLRKGLSKTRDILTTDIDELFPGRRKVDDALLEEIEELLITSDMGVQTTMDLMDRISKKSGKISTAEDLKSVLKAEIGALMGPAPKEKPVEKPHVIMVIGVNGVGKTTTIGKLAARYTGEGKKVLIAAADTFRAAAIEQLVIWAERAGAEIVKRRENADPASVAFDGLEAATAREKDIVIVDTAGRLHTKVNLMEELKKIQRALSKKMSRAPHEVLLVLDATTGQNALSQARMFDEALGVTGLVLTKLDGTAKGGVVVSICDSLEIPLKYIGVGEGIEDLQKFDPDRFVEALFS
ncbi:MAG: signal recognition particle-docking protein FtsY [Thermodesulfobacteriota bacterium]